MRYLNCWRDGLGAGMVGVAALLVGVGCGGNDDPPPSNPPSFEGATLQCASVDGNGVDQPVVQQVSVKVTDPERDLTTQNGQLCGTLNGLPIALGDPDADGNFTWKPSKKLDDNPCDGEIPLDKNRMVCDGPFDLYVSASDTDGNAAQFDREVQPSGSK